MPSVRLHLNARLQPVHRGEYFEDVLEEVLRNNNLGAVIGGGALQSESGEIECCGIEMELANALDGTLDTYPLCAKCRVVQVA